MGKDKEIREPIPDPARGPFQHSNNLPLVETRTVINAEGKTLVYPKDEEGVDYNASSDEDGTEAKPLELADSPLTETTEAPPAFLGETSGVKAEEQELPATEMPDQPATSTAVMPHQHGSDIVSSQPQSGQPSTQHTASDKDGRLSPLSDANFNPSGISTTQYEKVKQVYGQMLDGYRSPGGSLINMDALMMVGFAAIQPGK
jgi:hypothetical protein